MDFWIGKFVNGVLMYSPSHSGRDGDKGVGLPSLIFMVLINESYLVYLCVRVRLGNLS